MSDEVQHHFELARQLHTRRLYAEAAEEYRRFLQHKPDHANARLRLGKALAMLKRDEDAVAEYREAIRLAPALLDAHLGLAEAFVRLDRPDEAIPECRSVLAEDPESQRAYYGLANALVKKRKWEEAEAAFRKSLALKPGDARAVRGLAIALSDAGKLEEAEVSYREAIRMEPGSVRAHSGLAAVLLKARRYGEAFDECNEAIRLDPNYVLAWVRLGEANRALATPDGSPERWEAARDAYAAALRIRPEDVRAMQGLAHSLKELGSLEEAERVIWKAIALGPTDKESLHLLSYIQVARERGLPWWRRIGKIFGQMRDLRAVMNAGAPREFQPGSNQDESEG